MLKPKIIKTASMKNYKNSIYEGYNDKGSKNRKMIHRN